MSNVPAKARTTPPHRSCPDATSTAAANVSAVPTTVIWFGVTGSRLSAVISACARRRTQASNRVVNIHHLSRHHLSLRAHLARFLVYLQDLRRDLLPCITAGLLDPVVAHPAPQRRVARQDDQGRAELSPGFRPHGQA